MERNRWLGRKAQLLSEFFKERTFYMKPHKKSIAFGNRGIDEFDGSSSVFSPQILIRFWRLFISDNRNVFFPRRGLQLFAFMRMEEMQMTIVFP